MDKWIKIQNICHLSFLISNLPSMLVLTYLLGMEYHRWDLNPLPLDEKPELLLATITNNTN